jgi:hypothetical protein
MCCANIQLHTFSMSSYAEETGSPRQREATSMASAASDDDDPLVGRTAALHALYALNIFHVQTVERGLLVTLRIKMCTFKRTAL